MTESAPRVLAAKAAPRADRRFAYRLAVKIGVPAALVLYVVYCQSQPPTQWDRFHWFFSAFVAAVYLGVMLRGRLRDTMTVIAWLLFCLAALEVYSVLAYARAVDVNTPGLSVSRDIIGWGPEHPGVYHHKKIGADGRLLVDTDYTIDEHLHRKVNSAAAGAPTVAFFGGSDAFGSGLPDSDTLPQQFADATSRRLHVVNLAFSAYGPQQLLRALETGLWDDDLKNTRLVVMKTAAWEAEWTGCIPGYMWRAPRYEMVNGQPVFRGSCAERWSLPLRLLFTSTSLYGALIEPHLEGPSSEKLDLFVATYARIAAIIRQRYGAPSVLLYWPDTRYLASAGITDAQLMERLRGSGLIVVDSFFSQSDFPDRPLFIVGDGHPTVTFNHAAAQRLLDKLDKSLFETP